MATPLVRTATAQDAQSIRVLLELAGLPTADLVSSQPEFIVACQDTRIIGSEALQSAGANDPPILSPRNLSLSSPVKTRGSLAPALCSASEPLLCCAPWSLKSGRAVRA